MNICSLMISFLLVGSLIGGAAWICFESERRDCKYWLLISFVSLFVPKLSNNEEIGTLASDPWAFSYNFRPGKKIYEYHAWENSLSVGCSVGLAWFSIFWSVFGIVSPNMTNIGLTFIALRFISLNKIYRVNLKQ